MRLKKFDFNLKENKKKKSIIVVAVIVLVLLIGITIYATYAAYKETKSYNIIQGQVGNFVANADVSVTIKIVKSDGTESYASEFPSSSDYTYSAEKSSCKNGSTITFNESVWTATISSSTIDKCTLYFEEISE